MTKKKVQDRTLKIDRFKVMAGDSARDALNLPMGAILRHRSGNKMLRCPVCRSIQWTPLEMVGPDDAPTIKGHITCGNGECCKCETVFMIRAGIPKIVPHEEVVEAKRKRLKAMGLSEKLIEAGVRPPPKIDTHRMRLKRKAAAALNT